LEIIQYQGKDMRITYAVQLALSGIESKPSRMVLTLLGIAIGIASVILIVSLGKGAEAVILGEINGLGADTIVVEPGREPEGPTDFGDVFLTKSLTERDVAALRKKANVPHLVDMMPAVDVAGSASYKNETYKPQVVAGDAEFLGDVFNIVPEQGILFGEEEIRARASVAVIGSEAKRELFGVQEALGETITLNGRKFRIVGVLADEGQVAFLNFDKQIIIPYSTAQQYLLGISHFNRFIIKIDDPDNVARSVQDIDLTLREMHDLDATEDADYQINTQQALVEQVSTILGTLTIFLASMVAIALVVGGIGIMNIMLVSVAERTREIGLRKAVGAKERDILLQFLLEAIILTLLGGLIGVSAGIGLSVAATALINAVTELSWTFVFPFAATLYSLAISVIVGLIFGIYPARLAARKSPMEALRYE
jgi:putative ABC transport system permease protein